MQTGEATATYRLRRFRRKEPMAKGYRDSYELCDETTGEVLAGCDLIGQTMFATLRIRDAAQELWTLAPNRKVMPSRWRFCDPSGRIVLQFDQKVFLKMINPLCRVALVLRDGAGQERFRLVDPRRGIIDRIMIANVGDWTLLADGQPAARLTSLPRAVQEPVKGLFGRLKKLVVPADRGFVSAGRDHLLAAPAVLALLLLFEEVTDASVD